MRKRDVTDREVDEALRRHFAASGSERARRPGAPFPAGRGFADGVIAARDRARAAAARRTRLAGAALAAAAAFVVVALALLGGPADRAGGGRAARDRAPAPVREAADDLALPEAPALALPGLEAVPPPGPVGAEAALEFTYLDGLVPSWQTLE